MFDPDAGPILFAIVAVWVLAGAFVAWYADSKGQSAGVWLVVSLLLSPILAMLIVAVLPERLPAPTKKCPHCAELIQPDAAVCRYCHLSVSEPAAQAATVADRA